MPLLILFFLSATIAFASHIVGGEVYYKYLGPGSTAGSSKYEISLRLFRDCNVPCGDGTNVACLPLRPSVTIYSAASPYIRARILGLPLRDSLSLTLTTYPSCVAYKPSVCYEVKIYSDTVSLADNDVGYIVAFQNCCRAASKNQFGVEFTASGVPGATYTASIPGQNILPSGHNNGAVFKLKDTALVCSETKFSIDFGAVDADGDSLSYSFVDAYNGGIFWSDGCTATLETGLVCEGTFAGPPPYTHITYNTGLGFTGTQPLGPGIDIDPATGLINGTATDIPGRYVVNVFAYEWRNGVVIASHHKDFIIRVEDCNIPKAKLDPSYLNCDSFDLSFENKSTSPLIFSYYWDFGDPANALDTSSSPSPSYSFPDTGTYRVTLITNRGEKCADSTVTLAKVYPGFVPDFKADGGCVSTPYQFTDLTKSRYGVVNSWHWNFGDYPVTSDTSLSQNPLYLYPSPQETAVTLVVGDSKGCLDTILKPIVIFDKPPLQLTFKDSLTCAGDSLQLHAVDTVGSPVFTWSPALDINDPGIADPLVFPRSSTLYHIAVSDHGCSTQDSVMINVVSFASINIGADTTICLTDSIQLFPSTNAVNFKWSPPAGISDVSAKNPFVKPVSNTAYSVIASVGSCTASDSIHIKVVPYPQVSASPDITICYGQAPVLYAHTTAAYFTWAPSNTLINPTTLTPTSYASATTAYVITVTDSKGCPKPSSDTTIVTVLPPVNAFAGHDTIIVSNQPLQLHATGGTAYVWSPTTGMNDPLIADPVVILGEQYDSITYHVAVTNVAGCGAGDNIKVTVYKTMPDLFVPTAFTPNGDGHNDIIRPKAIGIKQFGYFRIFNRLGQLVYHTSSIDQGWDGNVSGKPQPAGTYVFMAQATDYTGKLISRKGTIVLLR
ncbi:MAG TPA: gliding motility-associated C-terminal domain-containing protein [Panacibacter sp.]|nr:gliding motility-associated C-terminal domain-containing protein [Panacibacter sp.]HNP43561.1 gliding motility-associated C-terminal domain-containing protein [Panacibacter sp.]